MPRYIDADALLTDEMTHTLPVGCGRASGRVVVFVDDIEKAQTADVVPRAEIERLEKQIKELLISETCELHIPMEIAYRVRTEHPIFKAIKSEVVKEFAERLKKKKCHYSETEYTFDFDGVTVENIDAIAKEMTEEHYETQ